MDKCCIGFWVWFPKNSHEKVFVYRLPQSYQAVQLKLCKNCSKTPKNGGNWRKHEKSGNNDFYGVRNSRKHHDATTAGGVSTDPSSMTLHSIDPTFVIRANFLLLVWVCCCEKDKKTSRRKAQSFVFDKIIKIFLHIWVYFIPSR